MKFSLAASLLIVGITTVLASLQQSRLTTLHEERTVLVERATDLGIPVEVSPSGTPGKSGGTPGTGAALRKEAPGPSSPKALGKEFGAELLSFGKKIHEWETANKEPSLEDKKEIMAFFRRFLDLDPEALPHVIDEIRASKALDEDAKREIMMISLMAISQSAPEAALNLYVNSKDLLDEDMSEDIVPMALASWAMQDPAAAMAWIDQHGSALHEGMAAEARSAAIAASFRSDPEAAIKLTLALEPQHVSGLTRAFGDIVNDPQQQLAVLQTLEAQLGIPESNPIGGNLRGNGQILRTGLLRTLGSTIGRHSFAEARETLQSADLAPADLHDVVRGLAANSRRLQDRESWIPWIHENAAESDRTELVDQVVQQWTSSDFRSTAAWIGEQPSGPLREDATFAFARTVAPHEPASAAEWALTLPPSQERSSLLANIQAQWSAKDREAAAAFAAEHGLPPSPGGSGIIENP